MKKHFSILATLLITTLSSQAGITTVLRHFTRNNKPIRLTQQRQRYCQTSSTARNVTIEDVIRKTDEMEMRHGIGMRYFLNSLPAQQPSNMMKYLKLVDAYAQHRAESVPSIDVCLEHWKKQQQEKE